MGTSIYLNPKPFLPVPRLRLENIVGVDPPAEAEEEEEEEVPKDCVWIYRCAARDSAVDLAVVELRCVCVCVRV
jgi:hypothetical protein